MPSRADTSFLPLTTIVKYLSELPCQCPLGLIPHFYKTRMAILAVVASGVSMPSRADTSFLQIMQAEPSVAMVQGCQCPLGLIPHFYAGIVLLFIGLCEEVSMPSRADTSFLLIYSRNKPNRHYLCQCPLGLIPHFYLKLLLLNLILIMVMCQCPLGLIPHFY